MPISRGRVGLVAYGHSMGLDRSLVTQVKSPSLQITITYSGKSLRAENLQGSLFDLKNPDSRIASQSVESNQIRERAN